MQINYLDTVSSVLNMMKQPDSACKNIDMHRTCYTTLFKHLMEKSIPFSVDAALDWLEIKKQEISYETCSQYRNALFRLEHYLLFGDIESPFCRSEDSFFCRSGMSESFFRLTYELEKYYAANQNPSYYHTYSVATKEFFKLATSLGITEPEAVTIDTLIEYWNTYCKSCGSPDRCQNAVCAMTALMKYLHLRGDVPECYQLVLLGGNAEILPGMKLPKTGAAFHPSVPLEHKAEEYLDALDDWKYTESSKAVYRNDFTWYFMFLELNRLEHSAETVALWIDILPDCPNQSKASNSVSAHRSHTIKMFEKYLQGTMESNMTADPKRASDHLPPWKRNPNNRNRRQDNMNSNEKNTALYEKMAAEQDTFRDWLKSQSPEEVLNHAYEYTVREDIVMAMEELELSDAQAQALLDSPSPLADVYRHFEKLETGYMDVIRESIEERANEMHKAKEEQRAAPVYPHSAAYASEHGEMAQYRASLQASLACKEAIEQAINAHYGDNRLNTEAAVKEVLEQFGPERMQVILANTVLKKEHDGRISRDNKAWAKTIPMPEDGGDPRHSYVLVVDKVNPGLTDLFLKQARKVLQAPEKGSVLEKLKQEPPERKPAAPKKREPER